jgi:hypothetical protein
MKSILLSFSLRVAGGVLRRMKSMTRVALKAHMGRLRSGCFIYDTDQHHQQNSTYKISISYVKGLRMSGKSWVANGTLTIALAEPMTHQ